MWGFAASTIKPNMKLIPHRHRWFSTFLYYTATRLPWPLAVSRKIAHLSTRFYYTDADRL
jgi:hypothetical protein